MDAIGHPSHFKRSYMPGIMGTFDSLPPQQQAIAREMSSAARQTMVDHGLQPLNDDHAARLD